MIDFIILGQVPGTEIFLNLTTIAILLAAAFGWYAYRHHSKEKLRKQNNIVEKSL